MQHVSLSSFFFQQHNVNSLQIPALYPYISLYENLHTAKWYMYGPLRLITSHLSFALTSMQSYSQVPE